MFRPAPSLLTRRECLVFALLFLALLFLYRNKNSATRFVPLNVFQEYVHVDVSSLHAPEPEHWRTRTTWSPGGMPFTTIVSHVPGWTIFDNLYVLNGTVFVVSDDPDAVPKRNAITSTGIPLRNEPDMIEARIPSDRDLRLVTPVEAQDLFGSSADLVDGTTVRSFLLDGYRPLLLKHAKWIINDPPQFMAHYYHWTAELFFGFWRTYSSLDIAISENGSSFLPALRRIWFVHADADHWRDYASFDQYVLRSMFPSITAEYAADWADRAALGRPVLLDRVVFADRIACMQAPMFPKIKRTAAQPFALPGSVYWWSIVRGAVVKFSGAVDVVDRPVITYVSRQEWGRRKLRAEDHDRLVDALYDLRDRYGVEVNVASMHKLTHAEQVRLAARTTIMMGVHGNGLTALLWMKPSSRSTVIEFFYPKGFTHDYAFPARALGMKHYGMWNDRAFEYPEVTEINHPEGFQGNSIPLDGRVVGRLCVERLGLGDAAL